MSISAVGPAANFVPQVRPQQAVPAPEDGRLGGDSDGDNDGSRGRDRRRPRLTPAQGTRALRYPPAARWREDKGVVGLVLVHPTHAIGGVGDTLCLWSRVRRLADR